MRLDRQGDKDRKPQPSRPRDRDQDEPPREDPAPDPTEPVGDPEPASPPIRTMSDETTRALPTPSSADSSVLCGVCKMCGKSFASMMGLVDHEITAHPNVNVH